MQWTSGPLNTTQLLHIYSNNICSTSRDYYENGYKRLVVAPVVLFFGPKAIKYSVGVLRIRPALFCMFPIASKSHKNTTIN